MPAGGRRIPTYFLVGYLLCLLIVSSEYSLHHRHWSPAALLLLAGRACPMESSPTPSQFLQLPGRGKTLAASHGTVGGSFSLLWQPNPEDRTPKE